MELGIVVLLRAAWTAGILPVIIAEIPFPQCNLFKEVLLGFAKRGKIMQSSAHVSDYTHIHKLFLNLINSFKKKLLRSF